MNSTILNNSDSISKIKKLNAYKGAKYSFNKDGLIDVIGDVDISYSMLKNIPVQFGTIDGDFILVHNNFISLIGSPTEVTGEFSCAYNKNLTNLIGSPRKVGGYFNCSMCKLNSLIGSPEEVYDTFNCSYNFLTTLEYGPKIVKRDYLSYPNPLEHVAHLLLCKISGKIEAPFHCLDYYNEIKNQVIEIL